MDNSMIALDDAQIGVLHDLADAIRNGDPDALPMLVELAEGIQAKFEVIKAGVEVLVGQRNQAVEELDELKTALEDVDTDNPLVEEVYSSGFEAGQEAEMNDPYYDDSIYDSAHEAIVEEIQRAVGQNLGIGPHSKEVRGFVAALMDRHGLANDEEAQRTLTALYQAVTGI